MGCTAQSLQRRMVLTQSKIDDLLERVQRFISGEVIDDDIHEQLPPGFGGRVFRVTVGESHPDVAVKLRLLPDTAQREFYSMQALEAAG